MFRHAPLLPLILAGTGFAGTVHAAEAAPATVSTAPRVFHAPLVEAEAGRPLRIEVDVVGDWQLASLAVDARPVAETAWQTFELRRTGAETFEAVLPAEVVRGPALAYAIVSIARDGTRRDHFATREAPHLVEVEGRTEAEEQHLEVARYGGHRSAVSVRSRYTAYGARPVAIEPDQATERFSDHYWRIDAEYVYRPLRLIHDFRFGAGVMRSSWPSAEGQPLRDGDAPGLNYGAAEINLELHRWFSTGARLIIGAGSEGFVGGGAGIVRIGDMAATHFAAEIEGITEIGYRADLRLHWTTVARFPMALGVEFTDWPASDESPTATNLSYDLGWAVTDGAQVGLRVGAANRSASLNPGFEAGLSMRYGF